jgi:hypothetical protein
MEEPHFYRLRNWDRREERCKKGDGEMRKGLLKPSPPHELKQ